MELRAATPEDFARFTARTGHVLTPAARGVAAVGPDGALRGLVAFDGWTRAAAFAHVLLETPAAARRLFPAAARYAFGDAGRTVLVGLIQASHRRSRALAQRLGFRERYRVRDGWAPDEALVLYELRREDCRFLQETTP